MSTPPVVVTGYPLCAKAITPHDTNRLVDFNGDPADQYVLATAGGDVTVQPSNNPDGEYVTFTLPDGGITPVRCKLVRDTGTDATGLIGLF